MSIRRIVPNLKTADPAKAKEFYGDFLGLDVVMDQGWIVTYGSDAKMRPQISFMSEGGSGAPVPDISVEVDDVDEAYARAKSADYEIVHELRNEPWGVRRFFVRDPFGAIVNILAHE